MTIQVLFRNHFLKTSVTSASELQENIGYILVIDSSDIDHQ